MPGTRLLEHALRDRFAATKPARSPADLTIAFEHEFFLNSGERPASLEDSQALLLRVADTLKWRARHESDAVLGDYVSSIAPTSRHWPALKYEHPPHLLEIALAPATSVDALGAPLAELLGAIERAATEIGLSVLHEPFARYPATEALLWRSDAYRAELRRYRERWLRARGIAPRPDLINFSAVLAATQIHVGGLDAINNPAVVERLYTCEPPILWYAFLNTSSALPIGDRVRARHGTYHAALPDCPLLGFPDLPAWTVAAWADALSRMPQLGEQREQDPHQIIDHARDLQIVRPRTFGSIEFRADPAQRDANALLGLAALRMGCAAHALGRPHVARSWLEARAAWWQAVDSGHVVRDVALLEQVREGLDSRGFDEARYLHVFEV
ncbi:MAG: hypothetical protein JNK64_24180 [Myxococcales bacterium]|nr:hypothetical protein [Myxococcales bacterium]